MRIVPATDWFLVQELGKAPHIWRVACWYEQADETVIGLIGVPSSSGIPSLAKPNNSGGTYKHLSELSPKELKAVQTMGIRSADADTAG